MNQFLTRLVAFVLVFPGVVDVGVAQSAAHSKEDDARIPEASFLLSQVIARLPREPLHLRGDLTVRRRKGVVMRRLSFHILFDLGTEPSLAQYTIMDAFGEELERLTVVRRSGADPEFMYAAGNPLVAQPPPRLSRRIQGTDICWMDLTLAFLWWPGGTVAKTDEVRGRPCYVVEVDNPHAGASGDDRAAYCAAARLWIDEKLRMLLQAELLDAENAILRRLWVKSFKKIDDRWMIKDMEVESAPAIHRTTLTLREVSAGSS